MLAVGSSSVLDKLIPHSFGDVITLCQGSNDAKAAQATSGVPGTGG